MRLFRSLTGSDLWLHVLTWHLTLHTVSKVDPSSDNAKTMKLLLYPIRKSKRGALFLQSVW